MTQAVYRRTVQWNEMIWVIDFIDIQIEKST